MSNLIVPAGSMPQKRYELKLPPIEVPRHLREDFVVNPHMERGFFQAVQKALDMSLRDPDTALREPTTGALKQRIESCYKLVVTMRMEMKYPLQKCYDVLPQMFMQSLLEGKRPEDTVDAHVGASTAWDKGSQPEPMTVEVPKDT